MNHLSKLLDDFYGLYSRTGNGTIVDFKSAAELYDNIEKDLHKIEIDAGIKKTIWNDCRKHYNLFYSQHRLASDDQKKELLTEFYKSQLLDHYLNSLLKKDGTGEIIVIE